MSIRALEALEKIRPGMHPEMQELADWIDAIYPDTYFGQFYAEPDSRVFEVQFPNGAQLHCSMSTWPPTKQRITVRQTDRDLRTNSFGNYKNALGYYESSAAHKALEANSFSWPVGGEWPRASKKLAEVLNKCVSLHDAAVTVAASYIAIDKGYGDYYSAVENAAHKANCNHIFNGSRMNRSSNPDYVSGYTAGGVHFEIERSGDSSEIKLTGVTHENAPDLLLSLIASLKGNTGY